MTKTLVIIESPGKKKKLEALLGVDFRVLASFGHIRDLPEKEMGLEPPTFAPKYVETERAKRTIKELKTAAGASDRVILATDPDREGEAISWHLAEVLKLKKPERATYTEITEKAVKAAFSATRPIDMNLVRAQEARRSLDRIVGYTASPALSDATGTKLSAGRVQTPAVRLVVDRERAIRAFTPTNHFGVELIFEGEEAWKAVLNVKPLLQQGAEYLTDLATAEAAAAVRNVVVVDAGDAEKKMAPPAPFTTSTLQQVAQARLKFKPKKTMEIAQKLYEQGAITYMRTDSPNLSDEAYEAITGYARSKDLPIAEKRRSWKAKGNAQEAHEAIRPTHVDEAGVGENDDERALYQLIWSRAVASQLADATYAERLANLQDESGRFAYVAKGRTLIEKGWRALYDADDDDEGEEAESSNPVPVLSPGANLAPGESKILRKTTEPPQRYTEGKLVKELEAHGIGRPATYAAIIENITTIRGYIDVDKKGRLSATPTAEAIVDALVGRCGFVELSYTRDLEDDLDAIAEGKKTYRDVVAGAHGQLTKELGMLTGAGVQAAHHACPACGKAMRRLPSAKGPFWGCSGYPECRTSLPDVNGSPGAGEPKPSAEIHRCPNCSRALRRIVKAAKDDPKKKGWDFWGCTGHPECKATFENVNGKPNFNVKKRA